MKKLMLLLCLSLCCCMLFAGCGGQPSASSDGDAVGTTTSATAKKTKATKTTKADGTTKTDGTTTKADVTTTVADGTTTKADGTTKAGTTTTTVVATTTKDSSKADSLLTAIIDESISPGRCGSNHATLYDPSKDMESFIFYTDAHHAMHSYWKSTVESTFANLKRIFGITPASFIVDGGDWLGADDTPAQALEKLGYIVEQRKANGLEKVLHLAVGNHDTNYQGAEYEGAPSYSSGPLDNEEIAKVWYPEYGRNYYRFESDKSSNYVLDSQQDGVTDEMMEYIRKELHWLCNDLKGNNAAHINIFQHIIYHNDRLTDMASDLGRIIKAYNERIVFEYYGKVYDFSKNTGHIELVLSGHTHSEKATKLGGVPSVNCASYSQSAAGNGYAVYNVIKDFKSKKIHVYRMDTGECRCYKLL